MTATTRPDQTPHGGERTALEQSERKALEHQPEGYKDKARDEKIVEVGADLTDDPIKGFDPPPENSQPK